MTERVREIEFVVEQAGCPSCAARLRNAFEALAPVTAVEIDEAADTASVRLEASDDVSETAVDRVLDAASAGSGHVYTRRPGPFLVRA